MDLFDSINENNQDAVDISERYIKKSVEYYKLKLFQQIFISTSLFFKALIIGGLLLSTGLLSAFAFALFIGELLENYPLGFLSVAIIFLTLTIIMYLFRNSFNKIILKELSKKFFD